MEFIAKHKKAIIVGSSIAASTVAGYFGYKAYQKHREAACSEKPKEIAPEKVVAKKVAKK